jgi:mono/diheme cytochrome c family protein
VRKLNRSSASFRTILAILVALSVAGLLASSICSAQTAFRTTSPATNAAAATPPPAPAAITGAELYSINCNRCHAERYPTERTAANWKTINLHMQIRANIPPSQARLILKYLQDNSGR